MKRVLLCGAVVLGLVVTGSLTSTAQAAPDRRGPTLTVPAAGSLVLGQVMDDPYDLYGDGDLDFMTGGGTVEYRWTMTDPSGVCRYTIHEEHTAEGWYETPTIDVATHATTGRYTYRADEYPNSDDLSAIRITAYDCRGNATTVERRASYVTVERDLGPGVPSGWARTSCTCAMGDAMLRTSTYKTALSTTVNAQDLDTSIALIMAKGPARGRASVYLDGKFMATVDTYAPANLNRVVVWQTLLGGSADHTIKVVNQATSGRPRIDVDAVVSSSWSLWE